MKRTVARILRLKGRLLRRPVATGPLKVDEMHQTEMTVIAAVQREAFPKNYKRFNFLLQLNPIYVAAVLRVGGRLRNAPLDFDAKHPIIMPANSQVTRKCIFCQRRNSAFGKQYMANLSSCRVTPGNPPYHGEKGLFIWK